MLMRIIGCALAAGVIAGGASAFFQQALVVPLILDAEVYETGAAAAAHLHADGTAHAHDGAAEAGLGRLLTTAVMTVAVNIGFALLLLAAFHARDARPSLREGLVWGGAGFVAFMLAPAAGLAPELPGSAAAALESRQIWWAATAISAAAALWLIAFARRPVALAAAVLLLAAPHIVGAPQPESHEGVAPAGLAAAFAARTLAVGFVSWALLGAMAAWAWGRERAAAPLAA
jgi:cobalt transporter subunit CbtA